MKTSPRTLKSQNGSVSQIIFWSLALVIMVVVVVGMIKTAKSNESPRAAAERSGVLNIHLDSEWIAESNTVYYGDKFELVSVSFVGHSVSRRDSQSAHLTVRRKSPGVAKSFVLEVKEGEVTWVLLP